MVAHKTLMQTDEQFSGTEMVFQAFTILESRGYPGFTQLLSIIDDPEIVLKIIRLMYGMQIKIPPLTEFADCLRAAIYSFYDLHGQITATLQAKPLDIRNFLNISREEEARILKIFDEWTIYMNKNGKDIRNYLHINRNNTKKRIALNVEGKRWTAKNY